MTIHIDIVRNHYAASAQGDIGRMMADVSPQVRWTEMAGFPLAGTYRTPTGVTTNVMEALARDWDDWVAHDDTYVVDGEDVVVLARYTATNKATASTATSFFIAISPVRLVGKKHTPRIPGASRVATENRLRQR